MHVVVVGLGQVGEAVVRALEAQRHDVVAIDRDPERTAWAEEHFDVATLCGYGASARILKLAGCEKADLLVAVTDQDETNLVAALTAKHLGTRRGVARVQGADWVDIGGEDGVAVGLLGVDAVFNPRVLVARELARVARSAGALEVIELAEDRLEMVQLELAEGVRALGRPLSQLALPDGVRVGAILRAGTLLVPGGVDVLRPGDRAYLLGLPSVLPTVLSWFTERLVANHVAILGGGVVGSTLARQLVGTATRVTIIERDTDRAEQLAIEMPEATVVMGDGTDLHLLEEHRIGGCDLFFAVTAEDQANLLGALVARRAGVARTGILVHRGEYEQIYHQLGIDIVVSPRAMAADVILRHCRGVDVRKLTALAQGQAELIELQAPAGCRAVGVPLARLDLPRGAMVGAILKPDRVIVPGGADVIDAGDGVILITTSSARRGTARLFRGGSA